jgi:small redox-active disulfide protein 2
MEGWSMKTADFPLLQYSIPFYLTGRTLMEIKVLGPGCPRCEATKKNVEEAIAESGMDAKIEKVTDTMEIAKHGVFGTPAVVIDGKVKSVGKVPEKDEIKDWITE